MEPELNFDTSNFYKASQPLERFYLFVLESNSCYTVSRLSQFDYRNKLFDGDFVENNWNLSA